MVIVVATGIAEINHKCTITLLIALVLSSSGWASWAAGTDVAADGASNNESGFRLARPTPSNSPTAPSGTNGQQPFNAKEQQPIQTHGQQPFNTNGLQPFQTNGQQPFNTNGQQPFNLNAEVNGSVINPEQFRLAPPGSANFGQGGNQPFDLHTSRTTPPALDVGGAPPPVLDVADPNHMRLLANYQIELIVDRSLSMRRRDCPGRLSRWNWCGAQAEELARALYPFAPNGLTITAFAWRYDIYESVSTSLLANIFHHPNFALGTRLAEPLTDRLDSFFNRRAQDPRASSSGSNHRWRPRTYPRADDGTKRANLRQPLHENCQ